MNLVRYYQFTTGYGWISDCGNPNVMKYFGNLYKFSPLYNVHIPKNEKKQFPLTLIITADHDDLLSSLHSLKMAATIHHAVYNIIIINTRKI